MSSIKAVIWDLAGVVLRPLKGTFNTTLAERLDAPLYEIERVMGTKENSLWDMDKMDDDTFYTFLLNELNMPMGKKAVLERFVRDDFYVDRELLTYIKQIRKSFTTMLLTNFPAHVYDFMKTVWVMDGAFDHIVASCDVKLLKPDPAIYTLALDRLGYKAEVCVFIDDRDVNIKGAQAVGIKGILFQTRRQVIAELNTLLK